MEPTGQDGERERIERELEEHATEEERQRRGSTPTEEVMNRALQIDPGFEAEPGIEWHVGEDAGEVPEPPRE